MANLREYEPLNYLINLMPKKAQRGLTSLNVEWLSMDVNADFIAIGVNFGMVFLFNRKDRQMTKIRCQDKSGKITALKMLKALDHQVAIGTSTGTIELHLIPKPGRPQQVEMFSLKAHKSEVTCVEWSTNGMKLYSGDNQGAIVCTQVDFYEKNCTTLVILKESEPVVQLSYSRKSLLVSTWGRTVIFESDSKSIKQVGQQPRKCKGLFGANFIPAICKASDAKFYLSRPGLRLWRSDMDGKVEETLLFKDLINLGYPHLNLLQGTPSLIQDGQSETQFGPIILYKETLVVTWSYSSLFILDPIAKKVVGGCAGNLGSIMGVSVVGDEIFILTRGAGRPIIRIASSAEDIYSRSSGHTQFTIEELRVLQKQNEERRSKDDTQEEQSDSNNENKTNRVLKFFNKAADELAIGAKKTKMNIEKLEQKLKLSPNHSPLSERKTEATGTDKEEEPMTPAADLSEDILAAQFKAGAMNNENITSGSALNDNKDLKNDNFEMIEKDQEIKVNFAEIGKESFEDVLVFGGEKKKKRKKKKEKRKKNEDKPVSDFSIIPSDAVSSTANADNSTANADNDKASVISGDNVKETENHQQYVDDSRQVASEILSYDTELSNFSVLDFPSNDAHLSSNEVNEPPHNIVELSPKDMQHSRDDLDYSNGYEHKKVTDSINYVQNDLSKDDDKAINLNVGTLSSKEVINSCDDNVLHQNGFPIKPSPDYNNFNSDVFNEPGVSNESAASLKEDNIPRDPLSSAEFDIYSPHNTQENMPVEKPFDMDLISECSSDSHDTETSKEEFNVPEGMHQKVAGSWVHCDTPGIITQLLVSDKHIWCVDNHDKVHFKLINGTKNKWEKLRESAQLMAVSHTESIVWRVHRKTGKAFASAPITPRSPIGSKWAQVCSDVCYVSLDETIAWIVKTNYDVYVQQDLSRDCVTSRSIKVSSAHQIKLDQVVTSRGVVWGRVIDGTIVYRHGITARKPTGNQWVQFDNQSFDVVSMALDSRNNGWVIDQDGNVWFKTGVTMETPQGDTQHWWQVPMSEYLMQDPTGLEKLFNTMSFVGNHLFRVQHQPRPMLVGASSAGVWVVGSGHVKSSLYASKGNLIGHYWNMVCPHGLSQSTQWICVSASGAYSISGMIWALQKSGEVFCFPPDTMRPILVDPPTGNDSLWYLSSSAEGLWAIGESNTVYVRDGISHRHPQGLKWKTLNLSQLGPSKMVHFSCGSMAVWACDSDGVIHFRLGLCMPQNETMVPAWLQVDGKTTGSGTYFTNVYVGPTDNIVWALDNKRNVYARWGISSRLPIGLKWDVVPGTPASQLCVSSETVFALCPNGDVVRRHGITEKNPLGDYWKKIPGNYSFLSVSQNNELWAIDNEGHILQQCTKMFSRGGEHLMRTATIEEDDWDVI